MKKTKEPKDLNAFLRWAEKVSRENRLCLKGFWTYDMDYFSRPYLLKLVGEKVLVLNEQIGKKKNPEEIDAKTPLGEELPYEIKKIFAENETAPWYYKSKGKIMNKGYLAKTLKAKNDDEIFDRFPKTKEILYSEFKKKIGAPTYYIHADWAGLYFLSLAALCGKEFKEKTFSTKEMYGLRDFVLKEKPKGGVLSYVATHQDYAINFTGLIPVLNLFASQKLQYLKLLIVQKGKIEKIETEITNGKKEKIPVMGYYGKKQLEWVLAYSK